MSGDALAPPAGAAFQFADGCSLRIGDPHRAAFDDIAPVRRVEVAFVASARWKGAARAAHCRVFEQRLADGLAVPLGVERSRE